jgi:hypothetical protein
MQQEARFLDALKQVFFTKARQGGCAGSKLPEPAGSGRFLQRAAGENQKSSQNTGFFIRHGSRVPANNPLPPAARPI